MKRAALVVALLSSLALASPAPACPVYQPDPSEVIENPRFESANGRFTLVARRFPEISDFGSTTAGELYGLTDEPAPEELEDDAWYFLPDDYAPYQPEDPLERLRAETSSEESLDDEELPPIAVALYRNLESGVHFQVAQFTLDETSVPTHLAVSDDGNFVVTWAPPEPFITTTDSGPYFEPGVAIYDVSRGTPHRIDYPEVFTADDIAWLGRARIDAWSWQLREHPNTGRTALHMIFPPPAQWMLPVELDIDLETERLLQPKSDYYPTLGEVVVSAAPRERKPAGIGCESGALVPTIDSQTLLDRAKYSPVPKYTEVAFRAGVQGKVILEIVADEDGRVVCARTVKDLPFGLGEAAKTAITEWWFEPLVVDGKRVRFDGLVAVDFRFNGPGQR